MSIPFDTQLGVTLWRNKVCQQQYDGSRQRVGFESVAIMNVTLFVPPAAILLRQSHQQRLVPCSSGCPEKPPDQRKACICWTPAGCHLNTVYEFSVTQCQRSLMTCLNSDVEMFGIGSGHRDMKEESTSSCTSQPLFALMKHLHHLCPADFLLI